MATASCMRPIATSRLKMLIAFKVRSLEGTLRAVAHLFGPITQLSHCKWGYHKPTTSKPPLVRVFWNMPDHSCGFVKMQAWAQSRANAGVQEEWLVFNHDTGGLQDLHWLKDRGACLWVFELAESPSVFSLSFGDENVPVWYSRSSHRWELDDIGLAAHRRRGERQLNPQTVLCLIVFCHLFLSDSLCFFVAARRVVQEARADSSTDDSKSTVKLASTTLAFNGHCLSPLSFFLSLSLSRARAFFLSLFLPLKQPIKEQMEHVDWIVLPSGGHSCSLFFTLVYLG